MSHYDPATHQTVMSDDATLYDFFHEQAHKEQHKTHALAFKAWFWCRWYRGVNYLAELWIEWDAYRRARREMQRLGLWDNDCEVEARQKLRSYATRQPIT